MQRPACMHVCACLKRSWPLRLMSSCDWGGIFGNAARSRSERCRCWRRSWRQMRSDFRLLCARLSFCVCSSRQTEASASASELRACLSFLVRVCVSQCVLACVCSKSRGKALPYRVQIQTPLANGTNKTQCETNDARSKNCQHQTVAKWVILFVYMCVRVCSMRVCCRVYGRHVSLIAPQHGNNRWQPLHGLPQPPSDSVAHLLRHHANSQNFNCPWSTAPYRRRCCVGGVWPAISKSNSSRNRFSAAKKLIGCPSDQLKAGRKHSKPNTWKAAALRCQKWFPFFCFFFFLQLFQSAKEVVTGRGNGNGNGKGSGSSDVCQRFDRP